MATKQQSKSTKPTDYADQARQALNHYQDVEWLGEQSPLAAPYFLGERGGDSLTARERGQALQESLAAAAVAFWPGALPEDRETLLAAVNDERAEMGHKGARYLFLLLELRYLRRFFAPHLSPRADNDIAVCDFLNISRASYFNHLKIAQAALGEQLLRIAQPTLRLERPLRSATALIGREQLIAQCLADLQAGHTVALSGAGGVGKSTLAANLAGRWPQQPVFWYTLRPTFNDRLDCLLFSLGYFLHRQGASGLWRQLIADGGRLENPDLALAQARGDIQQLTAPPLICVDELDVIYPDADLLTAGQLQLREFVDGLRQTAPLLLIGQRPTPLADAHYALSGLTLPETAELLGRAAVAYTASELADLHAYTGGNPRLLQLSLILAQSGLPLGEVSRELPHTPALHALWQQLWQRLAQDEQELLQQLSVFRSPAPVDAWGNVDTLSRLQQQLVQQDDRGGMALLPVIRDLLYEDGRRFPVARREQCHLAAAEIRAMRGEFTAAAHHFHQAGETQSAVRVWFPQRRQEIGRGYGSAALALFQQVSARHLARREREALALIQAELYQLQGATEAGLTAIKAVPWLGNSEMTARAALLEGEFLNALGYPHRALERYEEGMAVAAGLLNQLVHFHYQRGITHVQQRQLEEAWREAQLAQYEAAHLQAIVKEESGDYAQAVAFFESALQFATEAGYEPGLARTHRELSKTWGRMAQLEKALHHAEQASRFFARVGDRLSQEKMNSSIAAHFFQAGRFQEAIQAAEPAVAFFEAARIPYWTAVTASTLAEAYYETGNSEAAAATAHKALRLEETHTQPYAYYTLGLVARAAEDLPQAAAYFQHSQRQAEANGDRYMEAYAWRAWGEVRLALEEQVQGRAAVETALRLFTTLGMAQEVDITRRVLAAI
jgi:tetratricopeptide (TPR) repeat protein